MLPTTHDKATVLVIDNTAANLSLISELLREQYRVRVANHGRTGIRLAQQSPRPDLILLDVMMPEIDGYEVCRILHQHPLTRDIPVVFLTACNEPEAEARGLALGAVDYIGKPVNPPTLAARVATHIELKRARDELRARNLLLEHEIDNRVGELLAMQDVTIQAMAALAETRDNETGAHILRTREVVRALAEELSQSPRFRTQLHPEVIRLIYKSAPLHDIGKIGIPDAILLKNGALTEAEFEIMKCHARIGRDAIRAAAAGQNGELLGGFLRYAEEIAFSHHEKYNGRGYPLGLAGDDIPLSARIMAVSDVYDALISRRVYKAPWPHDRAMEFLRSKCGIDFDPAIIDAMNVIETQVVAISARYRDPELHPPTAPVAAHETLGPTLSKDVVRPAADA